MLTDKDIKKLKDTLATKADLKPLATTADVKEIRTDLTNLELKFDKLGDAVDALPTKEDLVKILASTYDLAKLKVEHDHMKKVMRDKHHIEI